MSLREIEEELRILLEQIQRIAQSDASVLIRGGTDSIRKAFAQKIHVLSPRRDAPFLTINCVDINSDQLASVLFGNEKNAAANITLAKSSLMAAANGGTLFIDGIEETSGSVQLRLLHLLDRGESNIRLIAGTTSDLQALVLAGRFLDDLLYRINAVTLRVPPLRERSEEIPRLAEHFLRTLRLPGTP